MLPLVDTHCHLFLDAFDSDRDAVLANALRNGVDRIVNVGIDQKTNAQAVALAERFPGSFATVGLHPHSADDECDALRSECESLIDSNPRVVAVGEVGLDYFKSAVPRSRQCDVFRRMADLAGRKKLPLVVHSREAFNDTLEILKEAKGRHPALRAVFHCFSYGPDELQKALIEGFSVSFTGIVTYPKAGPVRESARLVPLERMMLETDAPYLAPQPVRGERNEPAFLTHTAKAVALIRGISLEALAEATTRNAHAFFGFA